MKLFQQLLLAPAALSLMAPMAASAREFNIDAMAEYSPVQKEQVTSINQFTDIYPTDWAYQALSNLVEQYGCVAGYPNGSFRGNRAMSRYEAAALLNACLDRVTDSTDELNRLVGEFKTELAVIKGKVDGLEGRVKELEATQFSTTTKLNGYSAWILGGADGFEDDVNEALAFTYDLRLTLETSFSGEDMLTTRLRSGNFGDSIWVQGQSFIETAYGSGNKLQVDRLFYTFPVGDQLTVTVGPQVRMDDSGMLGGYATAYPADMLLDFFTYAGGVSTQNLAGAGPGIGAVWEPVEGFTISGNYVAVGGGDSSSIGIAADETSSTSTWQAMYVGEQLGGQVTGAVAYAYDQNNGLTAGTNAAFGLRSDTSRNNFSVGGSWAPVDSGVVPSISAGYSFTNTDEEDDDLNSWYVGLNWNDVILDGNSFGGAIGQVPHLPDDDESLIAELYYSIGVTDNIKVTPMVFYIDNYTSEEVDDDVWGGVVKTTFTF